MRDSGCGISKSDKKNLFKLFGFGQSTKDRNRHGSGIGLNISQKIAKRLGGDITITSIEGSGTLATFTFEPFEFWEQSLFESEDIERDYPNIDSFSNAIPVPDTNANHHLV